MVLNRCIATWLTEDGSERRFYVYGPTAEDYYAENKFAYHEGRGILVHAEDCKNYWEEKGYARQPRERVDPPAKFFFSRHLSREPLQGGADEIRVGAPHVDGSPRGDAQSGDSEGRRPNLYLGHERNLINATVTHRGRMQAPKMDDESGDLTI